MLKFYSIYQLINIIINQEKLTMLLIVIILNMKVKDIRTKLYQLRNIFI